MRLRTVSEYLSAIFQVEHRQVDARDAYAASRSTSSWCVKSPSMCARFKDEVLPTGLLESLANGQTHVPRTDDDCICPRMLGPTESPDLTSREPQAPTHTI